MSAWSDEEWVPISAVEHFSYCPRQMALIHLEGIFDENVYTLRGRALHERVDQAEDRMERGVRVVRALPIWSERLGLVGKADVVEFRDDRPIPVEYKSGKVRDHVHAKRQLCAQAMCLEEMLQQRSERDTSTLGRVASACPSRSTSGSEGTPKRSCERFGS
jgi:CRISPR-associated exonuclease Cas4